jgi:hypothetical protein
MMIHYLSSLESSISARSQQLQLDAANVHRPYALRVNQEDISFLSIICHDVDGIRYRRAAWSDNNNNNKVQFGHGEFF